MPPHRKVAVHATISPYTKRRLDMLVNSGLFASGSDAVDKAICVLYSEHKDTLMTATAGRWG